MPIDSWQHSLVHALETQDPEIMKAAFKNAPPSQVAATIQMIKDQGHGYFRARRYEEALTCFNQLLSADTRDYYVLLQRAESFFALDKLDDALPAARYVISIHPEYPKAHALLGEICLKRKDKAGALASFEAALKLEPKNTAYAKQVAQLQKEVKQTQQVLDQLLEPDKADQPEVEMMPPPELPDICFDPRSLEEPVDLTEAPQDMLNGIIQFLRGFTILEAPRDVIMRIEDPTWTKFWLDLVARAAGKRLAVWGSEAGLLPLHARVSGATAVACWDPVPSLARLAQGTLHKNSLELARQQHGEAMAKLSQEEQKTFFQEYMAPYQIFDQQPTAEAPVQTAYDLFVCSELDHGLLGKGLVAAVKLARDHFRIPTDQIYPRHVEIHAMPISWSYQEQGFDLSGLDVYRWGLYPRRVRAESGWAALGPVRKIACLDLLALEETVLPCSFAIETSGTLHGFVYWYSFEALGLQFNSGPTGGCSWMGQAYAAVDPQSVSAGGTLAARLLVQEERLMLQTDPGPTLQRLGTLSEWRFTAVEDRSWNERYLASFNAHLQSHPTGAALVIGGETGLLAMAAARAGYQVTVVETSGNLCQALEHNARLNGLADRLQVLHRDCRSLELGKDLAEKVDLVLFDCFDCGLLGNGIIHYLAHVLKELAKPEVTLLPVRATLKAQLVERRIHRVGGYDLTLLTPYLFSTEYVRANLDKTPFKALSEPFTLYSFDFTAAEVKEEIQDYNTTVTAPGILGGIAMWYELELDGETVLSTQPDGPYAYRGQALQFISEFRVESGMNLGLRCRHTSSNVMVAVNPEGLDERLVSLPRFDPQWIKMQQALTEQNGQIMQHLRYDPKSFGEAAKVALAIAKKPQSWGIGQGVAQRFYETFLNS